MQDGALSDDSIQLICKEATRADGQTQIHLAFVAYVILCGCVCIRVDHLVDLLRPYRKYKPAHLLRILKQVIDIFQD